MTDLTKKFFIASLAVNQDCEDVFLLIAAELRHTARQDPYLLLTLGDKSGDMRAFLWSNSASSPEKLHGRLAPGDVVRVSGSVRAYRQCLQIDVKHLEKVKKADVPDSLLKELIRSTRFAVADLEEALHAAIASITDPFLRELLQLMLADTERHILQRLRVMPAAQKIHHNFRGGLLEHTVNLLKLAASLEAAAVYPDLNWSLIKAGVILHDIGKVYELSENDSGVPEYTSMGRLLGHIYIGSRLVDSYIGKVKNFPASLRLQLIHTILSHHGKREWGSPVDMHLPEAVVLHHLDLLDAAMGHYQNIMAATHASPGQVTDRGDSVLRRMFYIPLATNTDPEPEDPRR